MNRTLVSLLSGIGIGVLLTNWLGPRFIAWYFEPPVEIGVNCRPAVEWALTRFQWSQSIGALIGAIAGIVLYKWWSAKSEDKRPRL